MLLSMTGYGRAKGIYQDKTIMVELRSLNSKFTDIRFKMPQIYREKEVAFRKVTNDSVERGKIDIMIDAKSLGGDDNYSLNKNLFKKYYAELSELSDELGVEKGDIVQTILRIPNVVSTGQDEIEEAEWAAIFDILNEAIVEFNKFRAEEGAAMEQDLRDAIAAIRAAVTEIQPYEEARIPKIRQRMLQNLEEFLGKENVDKNRFEQEVIFYIEKIDINEEKVRLEQHCKYFLEELSKKNSQKGRKLSFITQEMGREINTLGSKAYSSDIQRCVVKMKDHLEKIKEQVANSV